MRWDRMRRSTNVEDRRQRPAGRMGGPIKLGGGGLLIVLVISLFLGINPLELLGPTSGLPGAGQATRPNAPPETQGSSQSDTQSEFVRAVLGDTEDTWRRIFRSGGREYREPSLVLFRGRVDSACGFASSAVGPFYCPGDRKVYLDLSFFDDLSQRFGAPGEFARAYVIAHEIGHHVQLLLGVAEQVQREGARLSTEQRNALSVRQELQADCLAGVWGHFAAQRGLVDTRDIEAGLRAVAAIGDDRLQRRSQGQVVPEAFTHGSSAQRTRWFRRGLDSGDPGSCDTFAAADL